MSTWALVLAILGWFVITWFVALVLAIVTLGRGESAVIRGRGRAIAALVICGVWAVVFAAVVAVGVMSDARSDGRSAPRTTPTSGSVSAVDLTRGDCIRDHQDDGLTLSLTVVPCAEPHHGEVYAEFDLDADVYPGDKETIRLAEKGCVEEVRGYSRKSLRGLGVAYLYPQDQESFSLDTSVTCIFDSASARTGSVG